MSDYALTSAVALQSVGFEVLFSTMAGSPTDQRPTTDGLQKIPVASFDVTSWPGLLKIGRSFRPQIIIANDGQDAAAAMLLKQMLPSVQVMLRMRGQDLKGSSWLNRLRWRASSLSIDGIITPCEKIKQQLHGMHVRQPIAHIPLGRDGHKFRANPQVRESDKRPEIMIVGRFDPVKGHHRAMEIFASCLRQWPRHRPRPFLHIVGQPANLSVDDLCISAKSTGLALGDDLKITAEKVDSLPEWMSRCDLGFVSSLDSEVICRVAEEFLLTGTPIMVSGVGSLKEVLFEGAGVHYQNLDVEAAGEIMSRQLLLSIDETPDDRTQRAMRAGQRYSIETMAQSLSSFVSGFTGQ